MFQHELVYHYLSTSRPPQLTIMIYTHVLNRGGQGVVSPLDRL
jgi:hypothetical protein